MSTVSKVILVVVALIVVSFGVAFMTSHYLVSKLDGTGGNKAPQEEQGQGELYSSEDGFSFFYPSDYELSSRTESAGGSQWDALVLLPKGYVPPQGGEGPPAITVSVFSNPEGLSLESWVKKDDRSNWKLAADPNGLQSITVGGEPALAYRHSGLYETEAVAVAHSGKIFLFEGGWLTPQDKIVADFQNLVRTIYFTQ